MELQNRIGIRVQALRKANGLTQEGLADAAAKSVDTLSLIERGRILPAIDTLMAIAQAMGVSVQELLPTEDDVPDAPQDILRLKEAAWAALSQMDAATLAVALTQLEALAGLQQDRMP